MIGLKQRVPNGNGNEIPRRVHLIGAGGVHMSAIGQILIARGHVISGSDLAASDYTRRLEALGATIFIGHAAAQVGDAGLVVATAAARATNPELAAAHERAIPVMLRAEMVQRLIADREVLAIAGTHGKTTTTAMVALMALRAQLDPLVLLGGDSRDLGGNVLAGAGRHAIVEADEYAEAFLQYTPQIALITNVEADHLDYYQNEERLFDAFRAFARAVVPDGILIVCEDSPVAARIGYERRNADARVERYAIDANDVEWRAFRLRRNEHGGTTFEVSLEGADLGRMVLGVPGRHNVANALGALALAMRAGVDFHRAAQAAEQFTGADRRFDLIGEIATGASPITLVDDYAHHPTEVRATISAARQRYPNRRLVACFQPHTFSRSRYLLEQFRTCFEGLDALYLVHTYAAREDADAGMDGRALAAEIVQPAPVYIESFDEAAARIASDLRPGDVFFTLGAGDVTELGPMVAARLEGRA
ncbi:MAG: UDP-N-acetylmuramate--L-alanine ligase [Chloroflexi bacterium]|nr:UDP-N-acetylmuramate--L-alanine ligase [Chloroflexota bacterium]MQC28018.1 UDP-N-acetylmuramate--L-alanine ligase [Chloroflexota bacterium]